MHLHNICIRRRWLILGMLIHGLTARAATDRCIAVVGTNDLHGAITPYRISANKNNTANDPNQVVMGGVSGLSAYVKTLRHVYGDRLVLVDGGDLFQGTLPSNLSLGRAVIDAYNLLGYAASAVGNHEFDFGALPGSNDRISVLKARMAEAHFPFLTLNIFDKVTGNRVNWPNTRPSVLRDVGGIKVGIMGISTVETPTVTKPDNVASLVFRDPVPLIREEAQMLRRQGAQLVILIGHVGGKCSRTDNPNDITGCATQGSDGELFAILQALPAGTIDVAVGGHTHQYLAHWVNGTATIESGARGQFIAWVDACIGPAGTFARAASRIHGPTPMCLTTFADGTCLRQAEATLPIRPAQFLGAEPTPMPEVEQAMQPYLAAVARQAAESIGAALPKPLGFTALTDLVAESMRRATRADFGLQNRGGIRATLPAGKVTFGQVFAVLPFDNNVARARMTGAQIDALVRLLYGRHGGLGGPSVVGLRITTGQGGLKIVTAKGHPLDPQRIYTLSTSDFIAQGGEGAGAVFKSLSADALQITSLSMRDAFSQLLVALYPS